MSILLDTASQMRDCPRIHGPYTNCRDRDGGGHGDENIEDRRLRTPTLLPTGLKSEQLTDSVSSMGVISSPPKKARNSKNLSLKMGPKKSNSAPSSPAFTPSPRRKPLAATLSLAVPSSPPLPPAAVDASRQTTQIPSDAYPDGPKPVFGNNVYLYSEPDISIARDFDVVVNVAKEVTNPFDTPPSSCPSLSSSTSSTGPSNATKEYIHVPWEHNSLIMADLPDLVDAIAQKAAAGKKILVHCQCGVSRSATLVIALVMKEKHMDVNQAYSYVKERSAAIGPNMGLIYQLSDYAHLLSQDDSKQSNTANTRPGLSRARSEICYPHSSSSSSPTSSSSDWARHSWNTLSLKSSPPTPNFNMSPPRKR